MDEKQKALHTLANSDDFLLITKTDDIIGVIGEYNSPKLTHLSWVIRNYFSLVATEINEDCTHKTKQAGSPNDGRDSVTTDPVGSNENGLASGE